MRFLTKFLNYCPRIAIQNNTKKAVLNVEARVDVRVQQFSRNMSQKSITSFFTKTPKKQTLDSSLDSNKSLESPGSKEETKKPKLELASPKSPVSRKAKKKPKLAADSPKLSVSKEEKKKPKFEAESPKKPLESSNNDISKCDNEEPVKSNSSSPDTTPVSKKSSKRERESSFIENEPLLRSRSSSPEITPVSKNNKKRLRIESSSDSNSSPIKKEIKPTKKSPPKKENKADNKAKVKKESKELKMESKEIKKENKETKNEKEKPFMNCFFKKKDEKYDEVLDKNTIADTDYTPLKPKYHPINDACWSSDEPVPYLALAKTLEVIEATSARLKIVEILSNFYRSVLVLTPDDLVPCVYLCLNKLAPAYESLELGVAETYLMKAIGQSTGKSLSQVKADAAKVGDLGLVAEQSKSTQRMMFKPASLTVRKVFGALKEVAGMSGTTVMNKKVAKIQSIFVACRQSEARYFIRSLAGKLRIGLAEQSVLQALAQATLTTPPCQEYPPKILDASSGVSAEVFKARLDEQALIIKTTYCECPNYDAVIPTILKHGVAALPDHCRLTPGVPLKPMLAHPTKGISEVFERFENLRFTCEWKYDGERAQIHIPTTKDGDKADLTKASIFSRNQENNTSKYPDVLGRLNTLLKESVNSCVLDCEAVAWDVDQKKILPFQILSTRKRKDANVADIKVQVCLFIFDLLYLNGQPLVKKPFLERRNLLKENFIEVEGEWLFATSRDCSTMDEVQEFLDESIKGSCEGLMVKTLEGKDATYEIAKRSRNWLKLKKDYLDGVGDTLDVVVIGGYHGRGKRTGVYGGFLLACYDPQSEEYQSICKIGTGFSDEDLVNHSKTLNEHKIDGPRNYYRFDSSHLPDVWFSPAAVWEVKCADLSLSPAHMAAIGLVHNEKGISLRFPRFVRVRDDKSAEDATSARQVADIYLNQDQVKNQAGNSAQNIEEDFY